MNKGKVYIVGAGCGDADLITVRGASALRECEAVIYDALIDPTLLARCPPDAERLYVGKRSGRHSLNQEEINKLMIAKASEGKTVVRLKGGDPFVFGRGGEEILALRKEGIPYEVIPGISSAIAIPELSGIPLTHRQLSRSFHVITAHTADTSDGLPEYLDSLAKLPGTLVFLMGLSHLRDIASKLISAGAPSYRPAAVISGGNSPNPAAVRGTLGNIAELVERTGVLPPAVIVVGEVAGLDLRCPERLPLCGVTVGLTGTSSLSEKLRKGFSRSGAKTIQVEQSRIITLDPAFDYGQLQKECWIVFTSGNGVHLFFKKLENKGMDVRMLSNCHFAVIGAETEKALRTHGYFADLCPESFNSEALADRLIETAQEGSRIFLFRSAKGMPLLAEKLNSKYTVEDIHIYDVQSDHEIAASAQEQLDKLDYLVFSSAGGIDFFMEEHRKVPEQAKCICIGSTTAAHLAKLYSKPFLVAECVSAQGIISAVEEDWQTPK